MAVYNFMAMVSFISLSYLLQFLSICNYISNVKYFINTIIIIIIIIIIITTIIIIILVIIKFIWEGVADISGKLVTFWSL